MGPFKKHSVAIRISREMALDMGLEEPTPEEAAQREARHREYVIERNQRTLIREAAWAWLGSIKEPALRAVLDLHAMVDPEHPEWSDPTCAHCYDDTEMGDHTTWPCETIRAIADVRGIEVPKW